MFDVCTSHLRISRFSLISFLLCFPDTCILLYFVLCYLYVFSWYSHLLLITAVYKVNRQDKTRHLLQDPGIQSHTKMPIAA